MSTPDRVAAERAEIRHLARPLDDEADLDPLVERARGARYVLLGEASHGTAEYYYWRAALTRRLVADAGFTFVAVEGDWPDCFKVNRWVKGLDDAPSARAVLRCFARWPTWMWANEEVADFVGWLRDFNEGTGGRVGFYGLDVYSLWDSLASVADWLAAHDRGALDEARAAFACFEPYSEDPQEYAWATRMVPASCEDEVVALLAAVRRDARAMPAGRGTHVAEAEATLDARQNAEVVVSAERYYRTMVRANAGSWNVRDVHMTDTLDRLMAHHGPYARAVVWAHNTHVGDARATDMAASGMVNVGQLVRGRHAGEGVVVVGFAGHHGAVVAAPAWGAPTQVMDVPPAPVGTHEDLLVAAVPGDRLAVFPERRDGPWLSTRRDQRAIGVVYHPGAERYGNWVPTVMGRRYDALAWFEETGALRPLHLEAAQPGTEQETYPSNQ